MSLVNDMLNDLDERRNQQARNEVNLAWMTGQKKTSVNKWLMPLLLLAVIIIFVAVAFAIFSYQNTASSSAMDKLAAIKKETVVTSAKPVEAESTVVVDLPKPDRPMASVAVATPVVALGPAPKAPKVKESVSTPSSVVKNLPKTPVRSPRPLTLAQRDLIASQKAKKLLSQNQPRAAEEKLVSFMQANPLAIRSGKVLASLWLSQKKEVQAQRLLLPLMDVAPRDIDLIMIQARLWYSSDKADQAIALMKTERPGVSAHAGYYELLGFIARSSQQYELSVQSYRRLLEYDASRGDWWVGMAIALDMQSKKTLAKEAYRRGLDSRRISPSLSNYAQKRLAAL